MSHHHLMAFTWDTDLGEFLFPGLIINGTSSLIILSVVLIVFCVLYEGLKVFQTHTKARAARERIRQTPPPATESDNLLRRNNATSSPQQKKFLTLLGHTLLFLFHNIFGYLLMLVVMAYNFYVFIAVVFGLGLGYFLFGHISMKTNMDNIRAKTTNALHASAAPRDAVGGIDNRGSTTTYLSDLSTSRSSSSTTPEMSSSTNGTRKQLPLPTEPTNGNVLSCRL